jgi:DNA-directed RNA polymerase alpha subunit
MFDPTPDLGDDMPIERVRFTRLIRCSLTAAGLKTIGEIRGMSDTKLLLMRGVGISRLAHLRRSLGA